MLPQPPESQESIPAPDVTIINNENTYSFRDLTLTFGAIVVSQVDHIWQIPLTLTDPLGSLVGTYIKANAWFIDGDTCPDEEQLLKESVVSPDTIPATSNFPILFVDGSAIITISHFGSQWRWFAIIEMNSFITIGPQVTLGV